MKHRSKNAFRNTLTALFLVLTFSASAGYSGRMASQPAPPGPPPTNPHPATTPEDIRRVAFAEAALNAVLKFNGAAAAKDNAPYPLQIKIDVTAACVKSPACLDRNAELKAFRAVLVKAPGTLVETRHTHVIPWSFLQFQSRAKKSTSSDPSPNSTSKPAGIMADQEPMPSPNVAPDEYIAHTYARFAGSSAWHHVDVILSEDAQGNLSLRGFYIIKMPWSYSELPPGVVC